MRTHSLAWATGTVLLIGSGLAACGNSSSDGSSSFAGSGSLGAGAGGALNVAGAPVSAGAGAAPVGASGGGSAGSAAQAGSAGSAVQGGSGGGAGDSAPGGSGGATQAGAAGMGAGGGASNGPRVVMYLDNYTDPSWTGWVAKIDFTKMTHLNLAFALSSSKNDWDFGESDADVKAVVDKAHAAGVKVLASLGGGSGSKSVYTQYANPGNDDALVSNLDAFLKRLNLDGADMDIESGSNLGANFNTFVNKVSAVLKPEGKLVTAAVGSFLKDSYSADTLKSFDFVNLMTYANSLDRYTADAKWLTDVGVSKSKIVFGTGFHGADTDDNNEISYSELLKMDSEAWNKLEFKYNNITYYLADVDMTKQISTLSKGYGGIMAWTFTEDVTGEHSLWKAIQDTM